MNKLFDIDYSAIKSMTELLEALHQNNVPKNLYWRYMEKYQERKAREKGIPLYGQFELTPFCNLDCKMCYVHLNPEQMKGRKPLPAAWWKDTMKQAHSLGMAHATLTGGECLIYPEFDDIYMFLRSLGVKISIKSNGILLNQKRIEFFKKYPPRGITVSLYGSCNDAYCNVTGHAAFNAVYDNLMLLKDTDIPVNISITPSKYMYEDIEKLLDKVKVIGFPHSMNIMLFPPREETGRELCDLSMQEYIEIYKKLRTKKNPHTAKTEEPEETDTITHGEPQVGIKCGAGRSSFNISWDGEIKACENLDSKKNQFV